MLIAVTFGVLYHMVTIADSSVSPCGCFRDNPCFYKEELDYEEMACIKDFKITDMSKTLTAPLIEKITITIEKRPCDDYYNATTAIYMKGSVLPIRNKYLHIYKGKGHLLEYGFDEITERIVLYDIHFYAVHRTESGSIKALMYSRVECTGEPGKDIDMYMGCPLKDNMTDEIRCMFREKAKSCGFNISWYSLQ